MTKKSKEYWVLYKSVITEEVQYTSSVEYTEKFGYPIKECLDNKEILNVKHRLRYIIYGENCEYEVIIEQLDNGNIIKIKTYGVTTGGDTITIASGVNGKIDVTNIPTYIAKRILDAIKKFEFMRTAELARREREEVITRQ